MSSSPVNLDDFICSICREVFDSPVSLACPHTYCQSCVVGLKKSSSSTTDTAGTTPPASSFRSGSVSHSAHVHQAQQCYVCAICRQESLGFVRYREMDEQLASLQASCPHCSTLFILRDLRDHLETCTATKVTQAASGLQNKLPSTLAKQLSESQAKALQKAKEGENRSTFTCPFCQKLNFTATHLRQHIKKHHKTEDQHRVCPICSSMPWGDKTLVSSNVYQHIKSRHQFDYETYVNYEQDEAAMMRQAIQASLEHQ